MTPTARQQEEGFLKAYDEYADALFRHCYLHLSDREQAKDLVQETFMKTWEYITAGHKIQNLRAFLYKVLNNLIVDLYRKAKREKITSLSFLEDKGFEPMAAETASIETIVDVEFKTEKVRKLLNQLEIKYREVIVMRYIDGLPPRDIAKTLGTTENNISVRIHRGLKKLRHLFQRVNIENEQKV
jgi:RNA polymerase sigma-70 factor (ECF subfamily)